MEAAGFFVCTIDLEDELIRALGTGQVEQIIKARGELRSLRTLQRQPAQRDRPAPDQLRRRGTILDAQDHWPAGRLPHMLPMTARSLGV
jgi:hypothetical protein